MPIDEGHPNPEERAPAPQERDWFGNALPPRGRAAAPVPCPMCGIDHATREGLEAHLATAHGFSTHRGRSRTLGPRLLHWFRGLRFMPLWFVLPVNLLVTLLLAAWARDTGGVALFAEADQLPVMRTWILRLSLLPTVLVLTWRTVDRRV